MPMASRLAWVDAPTAAMADPPDGRACRDQDRGGEVELQEACEQPAQAEGGGQERERESHAVQAGLQHRVDVHAEPQQDDRALQQVAVQARGEVRGACAKDGLEGDARAECGDRSGLGQQAGEPDSGDGDAWEMSVGVHACEATGIPGILQIHRFYMKHIQKE